MSDRSSKEKASLIKMENSNTNSTKASMLEKITEKTIKGVGSTVSNVRKFDYNMGDREWTLGEVGKKIIVNPCIKTLVAGITFGGSICYKIGRFIYGGEKMMGENDDDMNQRYEMSVRQHYITKYRKRRDNWTFK